MFELQCPLCNKRVEGEVLVDGWVVDHTFENLKYGIKCPHCEDTFYLNYSLRNVDY